MACMACMAYDDTTCMACVAYDDTTCMACMAYDDTTCMACMAYDDTTCMTCVAYDDTTALCSPGLFVFHIVFLTVGSSQAMLFISLSTVIVVSGATARFRYLSRRHIP